MTASQEIPLENVAVEGLPYFTPAQKVAPGTALGSVDGKLPKIFEPLTIRGVTTPNRIWYSPMCQYSADTTRHNTPSVWHTAHHGGSWTRAGCGLTLVEATAVAPEGRITPQCLGLWTDEAIPAYTDLVQTAHALKQVIGIQLAHAGRKASAVAPWLSPAAVADPRDGGWPDAVVGPVGGPAGQWDENHAVPKALTIPEIHAITQKFADAAVRAVKAGFDLIEIHAAHGYLLSSFLSPATNTRTDAYGGSFENRTRMLRETVVAVRKVIPESMPLFVRVSGSELIEHKFATPEEADEKSWTVKSTAELAKVLAPLGVDLMDISAGGNHKDQSAHLLSQHSKTAPQAPLSAYVRKEVKKAGVNILVTAVSGIKTGKIAEEVLESGAADAVFVGRWFQQDPALVWTWARELGVDIQVCHQTEWPFKGRGSKKVVPIKKD
ncbi:FMN-linked oxidoreductase [Peziza echinospora]|nr:FMN-linked oxidoreductase [Peziza echinospora]